MLENDARSNELGCSTVGTANQSDHVEARLAEYLTARERLLAEIKALRKICQHTEVVEAEQTPRRAPTRMCVACRTEEEVKGDGEFHFLRTAERIVSQEELSKLRFPSIARKALYSGPN